MNKLLSRLLFLVIFCSLFSLFVGCPSPTGGDPATYKVTYDGNDNDGGTSPSDTTEYHQGQSVTVLGNTGGLFKAGLVFAGWNTQADGNGTSFIQGDTFVMGAFNITLWARWAASCVLTVGAGTGGSAVPAGASGVVEGVPVDITATADSGYSFKQWTVINGSGVVFEDNTAAATTVTLNAGSAEISADFNFVWSERSGPGALNWKAVTTSADGSILAACDRGTIASQGHIWRSTDGGLTWGNPSGVYARLWMSIASSADGSRLAACVDMEDIYTYENGSWTDHYLGGALFWFAIASSANGEILACSQEIGPLLTSVDGGDNWSVQSLSSFVTWRPVISGDGTMMAACASSRHIQTATRSGSTWTWTERTASGTLNWSCIASSFDGRILAAAVDGGYIHISLDYGTTWNTLSAAGARNWSSLTMSADGSFIAACVDGGDIWTSSDGGTAWIDRTPAGSRNWSSITTTSDGSKLAACDYGGSIWIGE